MPRLKIGRPRFEFPAVESRVAPGAKGVAPGARPEETDPDWQPL